MKNLIVLSILLLASAVHAGPITYTVISATEVIKSEVLRDGDLAKEKETIQWQIDALNSYLANNQALINAKAKIAKLEASLAILNGTAK